MIILDCAQNSPEWRRARMAIPTASELSQILSPKKLELSASAGKYRNQLLSEWFIDEPIDWGGQGSFMDRGTELEPEAVEYYEMTYDVDVERVGFVLRDDGMFGCSPDGLVGTEGGVEIKCPAMHTHIGYLLDPETLVDQYRLQVQGSLYLTGRQWWDVLSYNPSLPKVIRRVERDETAIKAIDNALKVFVADLVASREKLAPQRLRVAA